MKRNGKKSRKIRRLILACTLSAVVLIVATYTWFIGMRTVSVNSFEINIATTEGLFLSMDGSSWSYELKDIKSVAAYTGNTNSWAAEGLEPLSSVGDLDSTTSRMKLYEKGSLTTTPGGYRLLASQVDNKTVTAGTAEGTGTYIAFDLFIKNLSGAEYYVNNDVKNEEAIYLNTNSVVVESSTGAEGEFKTGIENSVRVAFTQIGRVKATIGTSTDEVSLVTGMTCAGSTTNSDYPVTGICRNAQIWEPNETKHVDGAVAWYTKSCAKRTAASNIYQLDKTQTDFAYSLSDECTAVTDDAYATYAISREIGIDDFVDVYDGLNKYTGNTAAYSAYETRRSLENADANDDDELSAEELAAADAKYKLVNFPYFTDEMKNKVGTERPEFMTLAPNSITKVRVYIWLEGQDIDNYDFAQLGKQITINFGFTKERFNEDYDGDGAPEYVGPTLETMGTNE